MDDVWDKVKADNKAAKKKGAAQKKDALDVGAMLPGPIKPPAAPATYKALTKIRLRVAPERVADIWTQKEINKGEVFRAVQAKEIEGTMFLKLDDTYEGKWIMDKGVAGQWAAKRVIKRVAGSQAQKGKAMHEISVMDRAEPVTSMPPEGADQGENDGGFASNEAQREPILAILEDPKVKELCKQAGISPEDLKGNPEFLRSVQRGLFGEEVVS